MGTRSLTRVMQDGKHYMNMYRQFDGYPSGHGAELAAFIKDRPIVNGYNDEDKRRRAFNGPGCLAASIVAQFKDGIGGIYLNPTEETDCWQDYEYVLTTDKDALSLTVKVIGYKGVEFEGTPAEFEAWCNKEDNE